MSRHSESGTEIALFDERGRDANRRLDVDYPFLKIEVIVAQNVLTIKGRAPQMLPGKARYQEYEPASVFRQFRLNNALDTDHSGRLNRARALLEKDWTNANPRQQPMGPGGTPESPRPNLAHSIDSGSRESNP